MVIVVLCTHVKPQADLAQLNALNQQTVALVDWQSSIDRLIQVDSPSRNSPWFEEKESPYGQISCHPYG